MKEDKMKTFPKYTFALLAFALIFVGCQNKENLTGPKIENQNTEFTVRVGDQSMEYPFFTEKNSKIGVISVVNDKTDMYVTYSVNEQWNLVKTYVHVAVDLNEIPFHTNGIPDTDLFAYKAKHDPFVKKYTYKIPLLNFSSLVGKEITIVACSIVQGNDPNSSEIPKIVPLYNRTTAWGGYNQAGSRVWHYILYGITGPNKESKTQRAMVRVNDNPADFTYHWANQSWYTYIVTKPAPSQQTFYFYSEKTRVGEVKIWKDQEYFYAKVTLDKPYYMTESHMNIQLIEYFGRPNFNLFPYSTMHHPSKYVYNYIIPWNSTWSNRKLYIALEGEVGPF